MNRHHLRAHGGIDNNCHHQYTQQSKNLVHDPNLPFKNSEKVTYSRRDDTVQPESTLCSVNLKKTRNLVACLRTDVNIEKRDESGGQTARVQLTGSSMLRRRLPLH